MTIKQIRFIDDYHCEVLWRTGLGWLPDDNVGEVAVEEFKFSEDLLKAIREFQQISINYWDIMEKIPGGGWSIHSKEEFETARLALGLPKYPTDEVKETMQAKLIEWIKIELPDEYELIEEPPLKATFPEFKDVISGIFLGR